MKRVLALLLCCVLFVGVFASCSDSETDDTTKTTQSTSGSGSGNTDGTDNNEGTVNPPYNYDLSEYIMLPDYKNYDFEIELDYVQQIIDSYLMEYAVKSKRNVCMPGDVVNVAYTGYRLDENGEILYENGKAVVFDEGESSGVYLGARLAITDFENGIVGMKLGEIKEIYATFPEDYMEESLAGKTVLFETVLNAIFEAPIYNNQFVSTRFPEYTNIYDYEEFIKSQIILDKAYTYIVENAEVIKYPAKEYGELATELEKTSESFEEQMGMSLDQYILLNYGMTRDEYIKSQLKKDMVSYAIADMENIEITSQMLTNEKASLINYYKEYYKGLGDSDSQALMKAKALVDDLGEDYIYENVLFEQVDNVLTHVVKVTEKAATYKSITQILAERESLTEGNEIGDLCPSYDMEIFDGNGPWGTTVDPSKNVGKVTIINFWGTWCMPCKNELPDFDALATNYKEYLTIYAVHSTEGYKNASEYVLENFPNSDIIFLKDYLTDPNNQYSGDVYFGALGGEGGYPYTVILDENGIIKYQHTGKLSYEELKEVVDGILGITAEQEPQDPPAEDNSASESTGDNETTIRPK